MNSKRQKYQIAKHSLVIELTLMFWKVVLLLQFTVVPEFQTFDLSYHKFFGPSFIGSQKSALL